MIGRGLHCPEPPVAVPGAQLRRLAVLAPFGVFPPRNGGHLAVLEPARQLARAGVAVDLFGLGIRRFEALRHWRSFRQELEPGLWEHRHVGLWNWLDFLRRGRSGLPPLHAAEHLARHPDPVLADLLARAEIGQSEQPWLFPLLRRDRPRVLVCQNVELDLVEALPRVGRPWRERTAALEGQAWQTADLVLCVTETDRDGMSRRYGPRPAHVVPLGVDCAALRPPTAAERDAARARLGIQDRFVVLFTGSWHLPNRAALARLQEWAETAPPEVLFVAAGSVAPRPTRSRRLWTTGPLPSLAAWRQAADCAVVPLVEGSGANVKLLEYLAAGLPVVTTPFGARGLDLVDGEHARVVPLAAFPDALAGLQRAAAAAARLGAAGRELVVGTRAWPVLAAQRRRLLDSLL